MNASNFRTYADRTQKYILQDALAGTAHFKHLTHNLTTSVVHCAFVFRRCHFTGVVIAADRSQIPNGLSEVRKHFGELTFQTIIQRNIRLSEAPSFGKPALLYDASSSGSINYLNLAKEFIKKNRNK